MLRSCGRHLSALVSNALRGGQRSASSLPEAAAAGAQYHRGECVSVADGVPPIVKLETRPWGVTPSLSAEEVASLTGGSFPSRIAVVRQAFSPHDHPPSQLSDLLKPVRPGLAAVHSQLTDPLERVLVDEYEAGGLPGAEYHVRRVGTELLRWLREHSVRLCFVPDVHAVATANSHTGASRQLRQSTNEVLMVAPSAFTFNDQAAQDNTFMHVKPEGLVVDGAPQADDNITRRVLREFAALHHELTEVAGVRVLLFEHGLHHGTPDACFPNNWFSTHAAGEGRVGASEGGDTLVLYPMKCPNRQAERRDDMVRVLRSRGYKVVHDMTQVEKEGRYFEGTGVLVLDRINGVVYCALSERAHRSVAEDWVDRMGYQDLVTFSSTDKHDSLVYHTNVMMAVGTDMAVVCLESVADDKERKHLMDRLSKRHKVIDISRTQMEALCGNVLELEDGRGLPVLAMSTRAYNAFTPEQRKEMRKHVAGLVHAPIDTLEHIGGGGVRCTLGELF